MHHSTKTDSVTELFGEVVSSYSRAQALEDGVLVDAGAMAQETGFKWPVAITAAAWSDCVVWSDADSERQVHQDQSGRLWDVLFMAQHAIRGNRSGGGAAHTGRRLVCLDPDCPAEREPDCVSCRRRRGLANGQDYRRDAHCRSCRECHGGR